MLRTLNVLPEYIAAMQCIADLSYAWLIIDNYTPFMQTSVKRDPGMVIRLRATFLKLSSALELPLIRISEVCITACSVLS